MNPRPITLDRFVRGALSVIALVLVIYLIKFLSGVLLPFAVAMLMAYLTFPLVRFLQTRCRVRSRIASILLAAILLLGAAVGFCFLIVPPMIEQGDRLRIIVNNYLQQRINTADLSGQVQVWAQEMLAQSDIREWLMGADVVGMAKEVIPRLMAAVSGTFGVFVGVFSFLMGVLYWVFILLDYEKITKGWITLVPVKHRQRVQTLAIDVEEGMRKYFKLQGLIAFIVGVLFSIGFSVIQLPMAIGLGLFVGLLNLVPYLQIVGLVPAVFLALLRASESGQSPWMALLGVAVVFLVVQAIQDGFLTPRIMGRNFGLNPAIMLLSLSVWGALLGFIGLIIALPLTTIVISYYRRYVINTDDTDPSSEKTKP